MGEGAVALKPDQLDLGPVGAGELVEDVEEQQHGFEPFEMRQAQQPVADPVRGVLRKPDARRGLAEHLPDRPQLVGVENAPRGKVLGELDDDHFAADVRITLAAFVAMQHVRVGDDQILLRKVLHQIAHRSFAPDVQRQVEFVVLVEMEREIHLVVGPVVRDEQVVSAQRSDLFQNVLHTVRLSEQI